MKTNIIVRWQRVIHCNANKPLNAYLNLGNGTMFTIASYFYLCPKLKFFVGIERIGAFSFDTHTFKSAEYVHEKLTMNNLPDAEIMADWINEQLCLFPDNKPQYQGMYNKHYVQFTEQPIANVELPLITPIVLDLPNIPEKKDAYHN